MTELLAIIPARGGSKRIPRKNLALLGGRTLLAWTLDCAKASPAVTRIVVSTEDDEIAAAARAGGAEVVMRPPELATDATPSYDVVAHVVEVLNEREAYRPDLVMVLQVTSPFREPRDIAGALLVLRAGAEAVVSIRSDNERLNGAIYLLRRAALLAHRSICPPGVACYPMPPERSLDIDMPADLDEAARILHERTEVQHDGR
jgi:CMP-N-acetylneuraminic acid synthetase